MHAERADIDGRRAGVLQEWMPLSILSSAACWARELPPSSWLWRLLGTGTRRGAGLGESLVTEVSLVPFVSGRPRGLLVVPVDVDEGLRDDGKLSFFPPFRRGRTGVVFYWRRGGSASWS